MTSIQIRVAKLVLFRLESTQKKKKKKIQSWHLLQSFVKSVIIIEEKLSLCLVLFSWLVQWLITNGKGERKSNLFDYLYTRLSTYIHMSFCFRLFYGLIGNLNSSFICFFLPFFTTVVKRRMSAKTLIGLSSSFSSWKTKDWNRKWLLLLIVMIYCFLLLCKLVCI